MAGPLALGADVLGLDRLAARIGFLVIRGVPEADLAAWAARRLTLNPRALEWLARLGAAEGPLLLTVLSRGTPAAALRGFLGSPPVREALERAGAGGSAGIETGGKRERLARLPPGSVFIGDHRDARLVRRRAPPGVRFIQV